MHLSGSHRLQLKMNKSELRQFGVATFIEGDNTTHVLCRQVEISSLTTWVEADTLRLIAPQIRVQ